MLNLETRDFFIAVYLGQKQLINNVASLAFRVNQPIRGYDIKGIGLLTATPVNQSPQSWITLKVSGGRALCLIRNPGVGRAFFVKWECRLRVDSARFAVLQYQAP